MGQLVLYSSLLGKFNYVKVLEFNRQDLACRYHFSKPVNRKRPAQRASIDQRDPGVLDNPEREE